MDYSEQNQPTKGYVVVASGKKFFYLSAINLIESIKYYNPEAKVTLFTEAHFLDGQEVCANVVDTSIDSHARAKLLGMAKSPYDLTFYVDADCECEHEDIAKVFDELGDYDIMFTGLPEDRHYCYAEVFFEGARKPDGREGGFELCGAVCLYDMRKPLVKEFMKEWHQLTVAQYNREWWPLNAEGQEDYHNYPASFKRWDQFSLWWLVNKVDKYKDLKIGIMEDDARWNFFNGYRYEHNKAPVVLRHYSNTGAKKANYD